MALTRRKKKRRRLQN